MKLFNPETKKDYLFLGSFMFSVSYIGLFLSMPVILEVFLKW